LKDAVCSECGGEKNIEPHHPTPINWERIFTVIREEILTDDMIPMCKECHKKESE